ncbi:MAG: HPr family phosphocarrier protein [Clostridia bacterium]|nr:HPr family phosphocarrier protein [Clostridia bacterium]
MKEFVYKIKDEVGIHARPAGLLVKFATEFKSDIRLTKGEKEADAKKIFSVMTLGVKCGDEVKISISGEDEELALEKLKQFFDENL